MKTIAIAMLCHSINAAYCQSLGDDSQVVWDDTPETHKQSLMAGVEMHLAHPDATPEQSHESWYKQKEAEGWRYGEIKDIEKKEHPCFLPYEELPLEQKAKDYLFRAMVHLSKDLPDSGEYLALLDEVKNLRDKVQSTVNIPSTIAMTSAMVGKAPHGTSLGAAGIAIQYIGRKDQFVDRLYGSNLVFARGQVRQVPSDIASSLLKHPEFQSYEQPVLEVNDTQDLPVDDTSTILNQAQLQKQKQDEQENLTLDEIDTVQRITEKSSLIEYAKHKYDRDLSERSSVKTLQGQVVELIKQFGVV